jgi:hypothetical protein
LGPHIFFDDQLAHLKPSAGRVPSVHIPFGIRNVDEVTPRNCPVLIQEGRRRDNAVATQRLSAIDAG